MSLIFSILKDYAIFAFIINFIREITKDCEDYNGDSQPDFTYKRAGGQLLLIRIPGL